MLLMLDNLRICDKDKYGTKAAALGELISKGEIVPKGFALSSEFFMKFLAFNGFLYTKEDYLCGNKEISKKILDGKFSIEMEEELYYFFSQIKDVNFKYAVRSSALCEDNEEYSMAGMFKTCIGLSTFNDVKEGIKQCYASLFEDEVIAYFIKNNLNYEELKMGVVIQEFIQGDYSGVNFSVDTIDMDKDVMHINIVNGICENYVSGKTKAAFYRVNRHDATIIEKKIPRDMMQPSKNLIILLYESVLRIEKIFGFYEDIEWTFKEGQLYVLQARPITTFKEKSFKVEWSQSEDASYTWYCEENRPYEPLIAELNLKIGAALNKGFYATGFQEFYSDYCIQNGYFYFRDREMKNQKLQEENFQNGMKELHRNNKNIFEDIILPELLCYKEELDKFIIKDDLTTAETVAFLDKATKYTEFLDEKHRIVTHGCDFLENFMEYCKSIWAEFDMEDFYDLVFNESILSKERTYYIEMAKVVNDEPVLLSIFKSCLYDELVYYRLKTAPESTTFLSLIDKFIKEFGICGLDSELESQYLKPLLMEAPYKIVGRVREFLNVSPDEFYRALSNSIKNKEVIKNNILKELDEIEKINFLSKLTLAEKAYLSRDNHHFYFERMMKSYIRLAIIKATEKLLNLDLINKEDDIKFLFLDEIKNGLIEEINYKVLIEERRELYKCQCKLLVPWFIGKKPVEEQSYVENIGLNQERIVLKGISGLRKNVKGRVLRGVPKSLEGDCILVLPYTRCGDIQAILTNVKGIIVENGSPFEHLGILAREMNIPVLYNVENAMRTFKDGDLILLNGIKGEVQLL